METSSTELNDLLSEIRQKIMLPSHLSKKHQKLIYKKKYENELLTEPVVAKIANEAFELQHIDKKKDLNHKKAIFTAIGLMKEKKDWANLPNLLAGMKLAGVNTNKLPMKNRILSLASKAGRHEVILECLWRVEDTGMQLKEPEFAINVMSAIQQRALNTDWHEHELAKALKWAELVLVMMEEPKHAGSRILAEDDPRLQPQVIGILLELASVKAVRYLEGRDVDGKVAEYSTRLLGTPLNFKPPVSEDEYALNPWLWAHVPVLHGMYEALKVLDPSSPVAEGLRTKSEELDLMVSTSYEKVADLASKENKSLVILHTYEKLLG
jgi:hypothetical protein